MQPVTNRAELLALHDELTKECKAIMVAKNHDYAGGKDDPFSNFMASKVLGVEPEIGLLMRCMDKFKRVEAFINAGELKVEGEGVMDAVKDVINYMVLCAGLLTVRIDANQKKKETIVEGEGEPIAHRPGRCVDDGEWHEVEEASDIKKVFDNCDDAELMQNSGGPVWIRGKKTPSITITGDIIPDLMRLGGTVTIKGSEPDYSAELSNDEHAVNIKQQDIEEYNKKHGFKMGQAGVARAWHEDGKAKGLYSDNEGPKD